MTRDQTWSYRNDGANVTLVRVEPYGDEIRVEPGSTLTVRASGGRAPTDGGPMLEASSEEAVITVWVQWPGSTATVHLDGREI